MKYSLQHYALSNPLNAQIAENMVDVEMLQMGNSSFEYKACFCFSNAYLICQKMIKESPVQVWRLPDYYSQTSFESHNKDLEMVMRAVTLTIVLILTEHFDEEWKSKNKRILEKIKDYILKLYVSGETIKLPGVAEIVKVLVPKTVCATIYDILRRGTNIDYVIPFDDILYPGTRIIDINNLESGKHVTRKEIEQIKKQIKDVDDRTSISQEQFNAIFYPEGDNAGDGKEQIIENENQSADDNLRRQLADAQNTIKEQAKIIETQITQNRNDNSEYIESLNRQLAEEKDKNELLKAEVKQLREVLELDKILESDTKRLRIDERIILISTALGVPWNSDLTNQTQLAKIIEHFSGDSWRSIRSRIVAINREIKEELKTPGDGLSQGTKEAISNVVAWLGKATRGERNTPTTDTLIQEIKDIFLNTKI